MLKKFVRSLAINRTLLYRLIVISGLGLFALIGFLALVGKEVKYLKAKSEAGLVAHIPEMEMALILANIDLDLGGTIIKNGVPYALINQNVYEVGDIFEEYYTIAHIERGIVVLENRSTKEQKTLSLPILPELN